MFVFELFSKLPDFLGIRYIHDMQEDILNGKKKQVAVSVNSE